MSIFYVVNKSSLNVYTHLQLTGNKRNLTEGSGKHVKLPNIKSFSCIFPQLIISNIHDIEIHVDWKLKIHKAQTLKELNLFN